LRGVQLGHARVLRSRPCWVKLFPRLCGERGKPSAAGSGSG
jgi:hypothetical protein